MNHRVPNFHEMEGDDSTPGPSISRLEKPITGEEEMMELLWKNGPVVVQSQNQRSSKKSGGEAVLPTEQQHLFMQEDEMASWLQYPIDYSSFGGDFYADLLCAAHPITTTTTAQPSAVTEIRPPLPAAKTNDPPPRVHNFVHFSRLPIRPRTAKESTVVESNETPAMGPDSRVPDMAADSRHPVNEESTTTKAAGSTSAAAGELAAGTCEVTITSSTEASRSSFSEETQPRPPAAEDRKRKAREADDTECQSEDKKEVGDSSSTKTKRSRAAEVHNLSERRRRDRINEKMRALQELIPRCNKSDKASMLDEAIEYLKSLQLQLQMMWMGCGMVPMMYPGITQYMPPARFPYPPAAPHIAARFPLPPFHIPVPDPPTMHATNHPNSTIPHPRQLPTFVDPYRQYLGTQLPLPQNQGVLQPNANKDMCNPERKPPYCYGISR